MKQASSVQLGLGQAPEDYALRANLVDALQGQGQAKEALNECRRLVELNPKSSDAYNRLGIVLSDHLRRTGESIAAFRHAIRLNPHDENAHYNLGIALQEEGHIKDAIAAYQEAIRVNPNDTDARSALREILS